MCKDVPGANLYPWATLQRMCTINLIVPFGQGSCCLGQVALEKISMQALFAIRCGGLSVLMLYFASFRQMSRRMWQSSGACAFSRVHHAHFNACKLLLLLELF